MKIKFLGTGSAFTLKNFQTNMAIEQNGKWLLLDAGGDIRFSLKENNLSIKDIDAIYISHLHTDHAGGIEYAAFNTFFDPNRKQKIKLIGNGQLLRDGWEDTWKGGLESFQGQLLGLNDFFDVISVKPNGYFIWEDIQFSIVQTMHIMNGYAIVPNFGLMIKPKGKDKTIFWTADCQYCPSQIIDFYKQADLIIQDCETTTFKSGVHASYSDLISLPKDIRSKMLLVHYNDNILNDQGILLNEWQEKASEFISFVPKGLEIDIDKYVWR